MSDSKSLTIKNSIVTLLQGLSFEGETAFSQVLGHARGQFESFPCVRVLPNDQTSEKWSQGESHRTVAFLVRVHVPVADDGSDFDYMYNLTDLIMGAIDTADEEGTINLNNGAYSLSATRGEWGDGSLQIGPALIADVDVRVTYSKDN